MIENSHMKALGDLIQVSENLFICQILAVFRMCECKKRH